MDLVDYMCLQALLGLCSRGRLSECSITCSQELQLIEHLGLVAFQGQNHNDLSFTPSGVGGRDKKLLHDCLTGSLSLYSFGDAVRNNN